jgi:hypothetical protein
MGRLDCALLAVPLLALPLLGCSFDARCPTALEDLSDPAVRDRFGAGLVAGTAIVQRYVDSPDPDFRGYDINITFRGVGLAEADQVMFVAAQGPIPDVQPGAEVLVVGGRGPRAAEIQSMGCPALVPLNASQ